MRLVTSLVTICFTSTILCPKQGHTSLSRRRRDGTFAKMSKLKGPNLEQTIPRFLNYSSRHILSLLDLLRRKYVLTHRPFAYCTHKISPNSLIPLGIVTNDIRKYGRSYPLDRKAHERDLDQLLECTLTSE